MPALYELHLASPVVSSLSCLSDLIQVKHKRLYALCSNNSLLLEVWP